MKKVILLACVALLGFNQANAQEAPAAKTKPAKTGQTKRIATQLVISFISKGAGIDHESVTKIEEFVKNHPKKPVYNTINKGKEGEFTMNFGLAELTPEEKTAFVAEIEKLIVKRDLVIVKSKLKKTKTKPDLQSK